jgi:hypothetical protein
MKRTKVMRRTQWKAPPTNSGKRLPALKAFKTNAAQITDGAHAARRCYLAGQISMRTKEGLAIRHLENEFARLRGHKCLDDVPVTARLKIQLAIGNLLFLSMYQPDPACKIGLVNFHTAQNTLNRILTELGLNLPKAEKDLNQYLAEFSEEDQS